MNWHENRMCVLDTETTGKNPCDARIVTACVAYVGGGLPTHTNTWLMDPGVEIPEEATTIHGITTETARTHGKQPRLVIPEIMFQLNAAWSNGWPVIAFNAAYDFTVLNRECNRHSINFTEPGPIIDPFVIDRHVDPYRTGSRTLTATCAHYNVRLDSAHDASADAIAAGRVAWAICRRYKEIAETPLQELNKMQTEWHAKRQEDFRAYLERSGKQADDVSCEWPYRKS